MDQLKLLALHFLPLPLLLELLCRAVQQKALIEQLAVLLNQLHIAHHMQPGAVLVHHLILHVYAVPWLGQGHDGGLQGFLVLLGHRLCHHVEAIRQKLIQRSVSQNV